MKKNFDIFYTSDTHGKIFPVDYATGQEKKCGLLNIASDIGKTGNTLVIDGGDSLQGTPMLEYYLEHKDSFPYHPVAEAFNDLQLDYYTLGNHDFNFGYDAIRDYVRAMKADCLCANVVDLRGEIPIHRTAIHRLDNGLRIGLTGVVTDFVNVWESEEHLKELAVTDPLEAAMDAYNELAGQCDITVCIYHGGYEEDLATGKKLSDTRENIACEIARMCDFDILLTGHQHMAVEGTSLYGAYTVQPPANAEKYIHLKVAVEVADPEPGDNFEYFGQYSGRNTKWERQNRTNGRGMESGGFTGGSLEDGMHSGEVYGISFDSKLEPVGGRHRDRVFRKLLPLEQKTEHWLDEPVGELREPVLPESKLEIGLHGSKVAALFNQVQLESVTADFSCVGLGNQEIGFGKTVSIRDIYAAYTFANTSEVKEITGAVLKEALEQCARYLELDAEGRPYISDYFMKPKIEHYNYDLYAGLDYAFDIRKPVGERVVRLRKLDGTEILPEESYRLVTSNYRATGTGGYEMIGQCPTVYTGADNVQDLIVDYIRKHKELEIPDNYRFEVIY
jgi:2',3'-cyclic-nucleotide 2'-phosphodiesterase/3'-nucleotidase